MVPCQENGQEKPQDQHDLDAVGNQGREAERLLGDLQPLVPHEGTGQVGQRPGNQLPVDQSL